MSHRLGVFLLFSFILTSFTASAFDVRPRSSKDDNVERHWLKSDLIRSNVPGAATAVQQFIRYTSVAGKLVPLGRMIVFELKKKNLIIGDPDELNMGIGFMFRFDRWEKWRDGNVRKYIGYSTKDNRVIQILWKEEKERLLFASAIVDGDFIAPISYEVEIMQRRLLDAEKSFAWIDFKNLFLGFISLPQAHADSRGIDRQIPSKDYLGTPEEIDRLVALIRPKEQRLFSRTYADLKDASIGLGQSPMALRAAQGQMMENKSALAEMFTASQFVQTAFAAVGPAVVTPVMLGNIFFDSLSAMGRFFWEKITKEKETAEKLKKSYENLKLFEASLQANTRAEAFKRGLIRLKLGLDALGIKKLEGETIAQHIEVYKRLREKYPKCGHDNNLDKLIEALEEVKPWEKNMLRNVDLCDMVRQMNAVINDNLIVKEKAREEFLDSVDVLIAQIKKEEKEIRETSKNVSKKEKNNVERLADAVDEKYNNIVDRFFAKMSRVIDSCKSLMREDIKDEKKLEDHCRSSYLESPEGQADTLAFRQAREELRIASDDTEQSAKLALVDSSGEKIEASLIPQKRVSNLAYVQRIMMEDRKCFGKAKKICPTDTISEARKKAEEFFNEQKIDENEYKAACKRSENK